MLAFACRPRSAWGAVVAAALFVTTLAPARAATMVNNLGETETGGGSIIGDPSLTIATPFTTGPGLWQIGDLVVRMYDAIGLTPDSLELVIRDDNGGEPGTNIVGNFDMVPIDVTTLSNYPYSPSPAFTLAGNTTYWLVARATALDAAYYWSVTSSPVDNGIDGWSIGDSNLASFDNGFTWNANGAEPGMFSLDATQVPEPNTMVLGLAGLIGLGLAARRRG